MPAPVHIPYPSPHSRSTRAMLVFLLFLVHARAHPTASGHLHLLFSVPGKLLPELSTGSPPSIQFSPKVSPPHRAFSDSPPPATSCLSQLFLLLDCPTGEGLMLTPRYVPGWCRVGAQPASAE